MLNRQGLSAMGREEEGFRSVTSEVVIEGNRDNFLLSPKVLHRLWNYIAQEGDEIFADAFALQAETFEVLLTNTGTMQIDPVGKDRKRGERIYISLRNGGNVALDRAVTEEEVTAALDKLGT